MSQAVHYSYFEHFIINNSYHPSEVCSFDWNGLHILRVVAFESLWNGVTYTDYNFDLTINNSSSSSEDVTACDSFDWNGVTYLRVVLILLSLLMILVVILQLL